MCSFCRIGGRVGGISSIAGVGLGVVSVGGVGVVLSARPLSLFTRHRNHEESTFEIVLFWEVRLGDGRVFFACVRTYSRRPLHFSTPSSTTDVHCYSQHFE